MLKIKSVVLRKQYPWGRRRKRLDRGSVVYINIEGKYVFESLVARKCRPTDVYRRLIAKGKVLEALGITNHELRWCQTAGCRCPCSPGFFMADKKAAKHDRGLIFYRKILRNEAREPMDIVVTIAEEA